MPILAILVILYVVIDGGLKAYADRNYNITKKLKEVIKE